MIDHPLDEGLVDRFVEDQQALQHRREIEAGAQMLGFEATFAVEDIAAATAAIEAAGGRRAAPQIYIEGVGRLGYFRDPEGNLFGAMQYDPGAF